MEGSTDIQNHPSESQTIPHKDMTPKDITPGYLPVEPVFEQYLKKNQNLQWVFLL